MKPTLGDYNNSCNERTPILSDEESSCSSVGVIVKIAHNVPIKKVFWKFNLILGWFPTRYVFAILGCFGFVNVYAMRVNLSVALVAMVMTVNPQQSDHSSVVCEELITRHVVNNTVIHDVSGSGEFDWDTNAQATILGAFFYGYIVTQIPGGILAEKFGTKIVFGIGIFATSFMTLLTPISAEWGVGYLIANRVIMGLGEGVTFPAMNVMIGRWVPKNERSRLATLIFSGSPIGTVMALILSGVLSGSPQFGWRWVFYINGILGCIWCVFWVFLAYDSPEDHPRISKEELRLIRDGQSERTRRSTPWKEILTSPRVWALAVTHFGQNWGFYTMLTELPTYLANVLHFNIKKNGILSSLPYVSHALIGVLASFFADSMRRKGYYKITFIRKIMNSVAFFGASICLLSIIFFGCDPLPILFLLTVALGVNGFMYSGFNVTHVDMSPEFSGTLMGITNCIANFSGFLAPAYVGKVTESGQSLHNWSIVFITTSCVYFVTAIIYNIFGSAELQPWG